MTPDFSQKYTQTNFITRRVINNFYNNIKSLLKNLPAQNALEVACGPGFSTRYLTQMRPDINWSASDVEEGLVTEAQNRNPQVKIRQESIYQMSSGENTFDLVIALEVLEHLERPEQAIQELKRVTKKYCLVSVPHEPLWRLLNMLRGHYWSRLGNTPGHINHWSSRNFKKFVSPHFKIIRTKHPWPWTILLLEKTLAEPS